MFDTVQVSVPGDDDDRAWIGQRPRMGSGACVSNRLLAAEKSNA
jgi:hypothetical protein